MAIQEDLKDIKKILKTNVEEEQAKKKKFRFPFGKRVGRGQKRRNYVTILLINENGIYNFKKYRINEQTIMHELVPRLATTDYVLFNKKGNPMIILPSWGVEPFSPKENFKTSLENGTNKKGFQILMSKMKSETIDAKKQMGGALKWIILLIIAAIIGYALLTGGV